MGMAKGISKVEMEGMCCVTAPCVICLRSGLWRSVCGLLVGCGCGLGGVQEVGGGGVFWFEKIVVAFASGGTVCSVCAELIVEIPLYVQLLVLPPFLLSICTDFSAQAFICVWFLCPGQFLPP